MAGFRKIIEHLSRRDTEVLVRQSNNTPVLRDSVNRSVPIEPTGVPISSLPGAGTPTDNDVVPGVQSETTKKFKLGDLLAWIKEQLNPSDIGAQEEITANGILKGDGAGGVNAAQPGTDYGTYSKPSGGIPSADMTSAVQTSLGKADTAYQKPSGGIPASDLANGVIPTVPSASTANPQMDGTASPGSTGEWADGGHVHPTDTSRAAAALEINGHALTGDFDLTAADVGALASDATAIAAARLSTSHQITGNAGWYKFFENTAGNYTYFSAVILVTETYATAPRSHGILSITHRVNSTGTNSVSVNWLATQFTPSKVRWELSGSKLSVYVLKSRVADGRLTFSVIGTGDRNGHAINLSSYWKAEMVETYPQTPANAPGGYALYFTDVPVSAGTNQQILSKTDANITADYVLACIEWANPSYITAGYTWTTAAGSFTLSGTATAATTANILLIRKGN